MDSNNKKLENLTLLYSIEKEKFLTTVTIYLNEKLLKTLNPEKEQNNLEFELSSENLIKSADSFFYILNKNDIYVKSIVVGFKDNIINLTFENKIFEDKNIRKFIDNLLKY